MFKTPADLPIQHARRVRFGNCELDFRNRTLRRGGEPVHLQPKSFATLEVLLRNAGQLLTKDELIGLVWPGQVVTDSALTRSIKEVRRALADDAQNPVYIQTIPRVGYRFVASTSAIRPSARYWAALALVAVLLVAAVVWWRPDRSLPPAEDMRTDIVALNADRFEQEGWRLLSRRGSSVTGAIAAFDQALSVDPRHARAMAGLAIGLMLSYTGTKLDLETEARVRQLIDQALAIAPGLGRALAARGLYLLGREDEGTEEQLRRAIAADAEYADSYSWLSNILHNQGRLNEAIEVRARALKLDPVNATLTGNLAMALASAGRFDKANALIESHQKVDGGSGPMTYPKASILLMRGQLADAAQVYRNYLSRNPHYPFSYHALAEILASIGLPDQAQLLLDLVSDRLCTSLVRQFRTQARILASRRDYPQLLEWARNHGDLDYLGATDKVAAQAAFHLGDDDEVVALLAERFRLPQAIAGSAGAFMPVADEAHFLAGSLIAQGRSAAAGQLLSAMETQIAFRFEHGFRDYAPLIFIQARNMALQQRDGQALQALRAAVKANWLDADNLQQDRRWSSLHGEAEFMRLSADVEQRRSGQQQQALDSGLLAWLAALDPSSTPCPDP